MSSSGAMANTTKRMIRIKDADKIAVQDLRVIALFFRIVKNYEKMLEIERRWKSERR